MANKIKLGIDFDNLPKPIKDWLVSSRLTLLISDLNRRLNISGIKKFVIPSLVGKLINTSLEPQDFVNELAAQLDLSQSAAKALTKEIERIALHPIENELKEELGIDIALLHFEREAEELPSISNIGPVSPQVRRAPSFVPPQPLAGETERHIESPRPSTIIETPQNAPSPFILHEERETVRPIAQPPRPTFSIKIPLKEKKYAPVVPRVTARVEMGEELENKRTGELENKRTKELENLKKAAERGDLPRPPMGALSAKPINQENIETRKHENMKTLEHESKSLTASGPLPLERENKSPVSDFRIRLKPIAGEPKRPISQKQENTKAPEQESPTSIPAYRQAGSPQFFEREEVPIKKVVNYTRWYTPLD